MRLKLTLINGLIILAGCLILSFPRKLSGEPFKMQSDTVAVRTFTIAGVGDIMLGSSFPSEKYLPPHDNPMILLGVLADTLKAADITFGNLEGSFLDRGEPFKRCRDTNLCYLFRMPERYAPALKESGFDLLSLANNHFGDFGWPAAVRTRQLLDSLGIRYAGPPEKSYSILEIDSVRIGFCAFSTTAGSLNMNDTQTAESLVRSLSAKCDFVIVSFHGGAEGSNYQRVIRTPEKFYGEDRGNVYAFAHLMVNSGADVVFGHGPHVTRAFEVYRERFIAYSLGNFCTYGRFNISGPNGYAPLVKITTDINGKFLSGRVIPVSQEPDGRVVIDSQKRALWKIRELTTLDFPDSEAVITEEGKIQYKQSYALQGEKN
jgi:hypothetical protein